jgi:hypothetical protein
VNNGNADLLRTTQGFLRWQADVVTAGSLEEILSVLRRAGWGLSETGYLLTIHQGQALSFL